MSSPGTDNPGSQRLGCAASTGRRTVPGMDVPAAELARELNVSTSTLLARADAYIGQVVAEHGLDAARGLSTHVRHGAIMLTPPLAKALTRS